MSIMKAKRAKMAVGAPVQKEKPAVLATHSHDFWPIPDLTRLDVAFGNIAHLPPYDAIPEEFKCRANSYVKFVSSWFFEGRTSDDMAHLHARSGVDRNKALIAIKAVLSSFEPKHEHKESGCAFLLHQWFTLEDR